MKAKNLAIALLSTAATISMTVSVALAQAWQINAANVNVRSEPSLNSTVRAALPQGVGVTVINRSGDWAYIVAGRVEGWVYSRYLTSVGSGSGSSGSSNQSATVNAADVNVRANPNPFAAIRATLPRGTGVTIINRNGNWAYIVAGRVEGWVFSRYLTVSGNSGSVPSPDTGTGGGNITPGPTPSAYESRGNMVNARFRGPALGRVSVEGNTAVVTATALGEGTLPTFSAAYRGDIISRSRDRMTINIRSFTSTATGGQTLQLPGQCEVNTSIDSSALRSYTCQANGSDHGRTVFAGQ